MMPLDAGAIATSYLSIPILAFTDSVKLSFIFAISYTYESIDS